jgi:hypothetical protein
MLVHLQLPGPGLILHSRELPFRHGWPLHDQNRLLLIPSRLSEHLQELPFWHCMSLHDLE